MTACHAPLEETGCVCRAGARLLAAYAVGAGALGAALPGPLPGALSAALLAGLAALLLPLPLLALRTGGVAARPAAGAQWLGSGLDPGPDGVSGSAGGAARCRKGALLGRGDGAQGAQRSAGADGCARAGTCEVPMAAGDGEARSAAAKAAPSSVVTVWAGAEDDVRAPLLSSCKVGTAARIYASASLPVLTLFLEYVTLVLLPALVMRASMSGAAGLHIMANMADMVMFKLSDLRHGPTG